MALTFWGPRNTHVRFIEARPDQQGVMRTLLEPYDDVSFANHDLVGRIDKVVKQV
jgi:hypothetical protein